MLVSLSIKNFALIDNIEVYFDRGLNIITGESGAGKSIIIEALSLVLGGRADKEMIRAGCEKAEVEAVFEIRKDSEIGDELRSMGLLEGEDDLIILCRELASNGRSVCRINHKTVNVSILKRIAHRLVDIHGQNEYQVLFDESTYQGLLDSFGGEPLKALKEEVSKVYRTYVQIDREIEKLKDEGNNPLEEEFIRYQLNEIAAANLKEGEEEELLKARKIMNNAEKIYEALFNVYSLLYDNKNGLSILEGLGEAIEKLEDISQYDGDIQGIIKYLNDSYYQIQDVCECVRKYMENLNFDPEKLNEVEERLHILSDLKRKYGRSVEQLIEYRSELQSKINRIENNIQILEQMQRQRSEIYEELLRRCSDLSRMREKVASQMEKAVSAELDQLGIKGVIFKVRINPRELSENGVDGVEFMISTNPGEPLKPLAKVVSGGEMSRIMLAFKKVFAEADGIDTLIFDEIDTGISGQTVQVVAEKILELSLKRQVICITHMPQIASMADTHYYIQKAVEKGRTHIKVEKLDDKGRIREISRIISGDNITPLALSHSKEMIANAIKLKEKIAQ
ncbi:DNA repair protein RecN [Caldanaerobius polysaccharolyticus]|uniref:DNA repair protein RecN n=1 Tax=Caldanaerobius polysaccharolyticus TaxID=44256 RepID=UPI00047A28E5|nr:DNA repair protein RecN [Caldanaerobius polysaccharolyticus]